MNNKRPKSTTLTWMWGRCICLRCRSLHWGRTVVRCGTRWVTITITIHGCPTWARGWKWILGIGWPCQSINMIQFSYHKQNSTLLIRLSWCNRIKDGCLRNTCSIPSTGKMFFSLPQNQAWLSTPHSSNQWIPGNLSLQVECLQFECKHLQLGVKNGTETIPPVHHMLSLNADGGQLYLWLFESFTPSDITLPQSDKCQTSHPPSPRLSVLQSLPGFSPIFIFYLADLHPTHSGWTSMLSA